jgi:hypothetical protein
MARIISPQNSWCNELQCGQNDACLIMHSLHEVHGGKAYRAGRVCPSVYPHDSTREPLDGFGLNLEWKLCHWGLA